ncbi:hypothetical protein WICPIJ_001172 [Wickerhamomyces pijperi]|uniref:Uncharacterized protein n=1 Tax=Wickerhamomyces pijperi TaxID=599730 RepID=A0A9P8QEM2_WICPI|nr:hypothetical protein WICPIJ_001172 [Wickerhamomyces pijperi]
MIDLMKQIFDFQNEGLKKFDIFPTCEQFIDPTVKLNFSCYGIIPGSLNILYDRGFPAVPSRQIPQWNRSESKGADTHSQQQHQNIFINIAGGAAYKFSDVGSISSVTDRNLVWAEFVKAMNSSVKPFISRILLDTKCMKKGGKDPPLPPSAPALVFRTYKDGSEETELRRQLLIWLKNTPSLTKT